VRITGESALARVHLKRARNDAVLTGIGTVLADDPLLTCRLPGMHSPVRVVLDSMLRLPIASRLVESARQTPLWLISGDAIPAERKRALEARGVEIMVAATGSGKIDLGAAVKLLAQRGITRLMVEAGPILAAAFMRADLVDEVALFRSSHDIGGEGIDALEGLPLSALTQSPRHERSGIERLGQDTLETFQRV
jgi:diaminohydroxyphosphoribosylaminopyrimidine deaminase/5-amino-6-(5-phosphoribosylamino)uracil reductase